MAQLAGCSRAKCAGGCDLSSLATGVFLPKWGDLRTANLRIDASEYCRVGLVPVSEGIGFRSGDF